MQPEKRKNEDVLAASSRKRKPKPKPRPNLMAVGIALLIIIMGSGLLIYSLTQRTQTLPSDSDSLPTLAVLAPSSTDVPAFITPDASAATIDETIFSIPGKKIIIDADNSLTLRLQPSLNSPIIEYISRGEVKTVLSEVNTTQANGVSDPQQTWWYVAGGYGWIPTYENGKPTWREFAPDQINIMVSEIEEQISLESTASLKYATLYASRAWLYMAQEQPDKALETINRAIQTTSDYSYIFHEIRGRINFELGNYADAIRDANFALEAGDNASVLKLRASAYANLGKYIEARRDFTAVLDELPEYGLIYANIASLINQGHNGDPSQLTYLEQAESFDPFLPSAYIMRGDFYVTNAIKSDDAIANYSTALSLMPKTDRYYTHALMGRAIMNTQQEEYDAALQDFEAGISIEPDNPEWYINRGLIYYFNLGEKSLAFNDFMTAVHQENQIAATYYNLAAILIAEEQYEAALYAYNRTLAIDPSFQDAYQKRVDLLDAHPSLDEGKIMLKPTIDLLITPIP